MHTLDDSPAKLPTLNHSTAAVIQQHVVKRGKRTLVRQLFHTKNDENAVAGWKLDLDRICRVFTVGSSVSVQRLLTFSFLGRT